MAATPLRAVRVPDELWHAAITTAQRHGTNVTAVVVAELRRMVADDPGTPCECVFSCADDPETACSLSGEFHVHPDLGFCLAHPDAPVTG